MTIMTAKMLTMLMMMAVMLQLMIHCLSSKIETPGLSLPLRPWWRLSKWDIRGESIYPFIHLICILCWFCENQAWSWNEGKSLWQNPQEATETGAEFHLPEADFVSLLLYVGHHWDSLTKETGPQQQPERYPQCRLTIGYVTWTVNWKHTNGLFSLFLDCR